MAYTTEKQNVELWSQWDGKPYPMSVDRHRGEDGKAEHINYVLDRVFSMQGNNFDGDKVFVEVPTASTGDVIFTDGIAYYCDSVGWRKLNALQFESWKESDSRDRSFLGHDWFGRD